MTDKKSFITLAHGANVIQLFTVVSYKFLYQVRVFAPGKTFQTSLLSVGKAGAYPIEDLFRCSTLG